MEWIEIIELTEDLIRVRYYPEQRSATGEFGEVTYLRKHDEWHIDKVAKGYPSSYGFHAGRAIQRHEKFSSGEFKREGIIGWY